MHPTVNDYVLVTVIGGLTGAAAMYFVERILNVFSWVKGDILLAIGDVFLHHRENALRVGILVHVLTALLFAPLYLLVLSTVGFVTLPNAVIAGGFFGFFHGLFVSLAFVWVASNEPMLPEFSGARLPLGIMHCAGHVAYGAVLGCMTALVLR